MREERTRNSCMDIVITSCRLDVNMNEFGVQGSKKDVNADFKLGEKAVRRQSH